MRRLSVLRGTLLACVVVLLASACGDSGGDVAETTPAPTTEATSTTEVATTTAPSSTSTTVAAGVGLPGPGEPWDVLFIGYGHSLTRLPGELYAAYAADALGVEVRLYEPPGFDHVYTAMLVEQLKGDRYPPLDEHVPPAEIIVLWSRPGYAPDGSHDHIQADELKCSPRGTGEAPTTTDLSAEYWAAYRKVLDEAYDQLWALREGAPTVLITADLFNSTPTEQRAAGIDSECKAWGQAWSAQLEEAATAHGSYFVSLREVFNGPDGDQDPAESDHIIFEMGTSRVTESGAQLIADALTGVGFEPRTQP